MALGRSVHSIPQTDKKVVKIGLKNKKLNIAAVVPI
jgi:hypothetical protein